MKIQFERSNPRQEDNIKKNDTIDCEGVCCIKLLQNRVY
jgi:hypothetical protein